MSTRQLNELCLLVLKDVYGELASTIVRTLFDRGRLTATGIGHHCELSLAAVQRALTALIQNRFVQHWSDNNKSLVYYTAYWPQIYAIIWSGQMLALMNEQGDSTSAEVVKNLHIYGHIRVEDFVQAYSETNRHEIEKSLVRLLQDRYLVPTFDFDFNPVEDIYNQFYTRRIQEMAQEKKAETAKVTVAKVAAMGDQERLFSQRLEPNSGLIAHDNDQKLKIPKQKRLTRIMGEGGRRGGDSIADKVYSADPNCVVSINHEKFLILSRNKQLVELASTRVGVVTSQVYAAVLKCYENKLNTCKDELVSSTDSNVTSLEIAQNIDGPLNLSDSVVIGTSVASNTKRSFNHDGSATAVTVTTKRLKTSKSYVSLNSNGQIVATNNGEDKSGMTSQQGLHDDNDNNDNNDDFKNNNNNGDDVIVDDDSDTSKLNYKVDIESLNRHLEVLADSLTHFLQKVGTRGGGEWFVPFNLLVQDLKLHTYDTIVLNKYGSAATRILRVVREKGKIDEKLLSQMTLLQSKHIRNYLSDLQSIGCVELQEVPRGNDRAPSRTFYLWYHRPITAYEQILQHLYKAMNRLYTRLMTERNRNPTLVNKLQREDVKGHEDEYLTELERKELNDMRHKEQKLLGQLFRIDELVRIFRDY